MGRLLIGCCGWRYKDWVKARNRPGALYQKNLPRSKYLETYARFFNTVEAPHTARGVLSDRVVANWVRLTPPNFHFSLLMWKRITHAKRLQHVEDLLEEWFRPLRALGSRLGVILITIPSVLKADHFGIFESFLDLLPSEYRYAIEFRDPSWQTGRTLNILKNKNIAWVSAYYTDEIQFLRFTGDFSYIRFRGAPKTYARFDRLRGDPLPIFEKMIEQIKAAIQRGDTYVFIDNQLAGNAPLSIALLKRMLQHPNFSDISLDERYILAT
ncbi:MAG: DUF72 domain-containing protein [Candidatus Ranarchaeia archaeon]